MKYILIALVTLLSACTPYKIEVREQPITPQPDSNGVACYIYPGFGISCVKVK